MANSASTISRARMLRNDRFRPAGFEVSAWPSDIPRAQTFHAHRPRFL